MRKEHKGQGEEEDRDGKGGGRDVWKRKAQKKKREETRQWAELMLSFFPPKTASAARLQLLWPPLQR